jgi:peptidoglycan/LPS O-acetylase OafA/YrhL
LSIEAAGSAPAGRVASHLSFRPDIEGLRAVAVTAVILNHLIGWPSGGFVGVDIFFVISGFLITGLLLREHDVRGAISIAGFYRRRIRRILPAASLVLVVTCIATFVIFAGRSRSVAIDAIWSFFFAANWHQAMVGTDYFQADGLMSPLQHYWSLAVEEQFYLIWPVLLILATGVTGRRWATAPETGRRVLAGGLLLVVIVLVGYALWDTSVHSSWAYFSTFSRAWELGVGALLAVVASGLMRLPGAARTAMLWAGLVAIGISLVVLDADSPVPAPGVILPVVGAAAILASGVGGPARGMGLLTNRVSGYVGRISYSLYLWHLPVIVVVGAMILPASPVSAVVAATLTAALAVASFHLLEDPIRRSGWLEPEPGHRGRGPRRRTVAVAGVAAMLVVAVTVGAGRPSDPASAAARPTTVGGSTRSASARLHQAIADALAASSWPNLSPAVSELGPSAKAPEWVTDGCLGHDVRSLDDPRSNADRCVYGAADATRTAVVLGDSIAISYVPALRAALEPDGWRILVFTMEQCPAESVTVITWKHEALPECDAFRTWTFDRVAQLRPDLVVLSSAENTVGRFVDRSYGDDALSEWESSLTRTLTILRRAAAHIVVLSSPPQGPNLQQCDTRFSVPTDCVSQPSDIRARLSVVEQRAVASQGSSVTYVDDKSWFCDAGDRCPSFVDGTPVYADGAHLTARYSSALSGVLRDVVLSAGGTDASRP